MLLQTIGLTKSIPTKDLFDKVNLTINEGDRFALVGENGAGKTTLLKILLGLEDSDEGQVVKQPNLVINWQPQDPTDDFVVEKFAELKSQVIRQESDYTQVISGLKLWDVLQKDAMTLSGGERTKIALASALITYSDMIILDEPTNYLDLDSLKWLESYLSRISRTLLVVSHDRVFLDKVAKGILVLEKGNIRNFSGNYTEYIETTQKEKILQGQRHETMKKNRDRLLAQVEAVKGQALHTEKETKNDCLRRYAKKVAKKAKSMEKRVDRMVTSETWIEKPIETPKIHLEFETSISAGQTLLSAKDISFGYDKEISILRNIDFRIETGEKIAILGPNGSGKSTLLGLLCKKLVPRSGAIWQNENAQLGIFSQRLSDINPAETVLEAAKSGRNVSDTTARNVLGSLLIFGDKVFEPVENLSLGEKTKLGFARLLISSPDLLILDEFSAHLDLDSLAKIEEAINEFQGAVLIVTHDRYMLEKLKLDRSYLLENAELKQIHTELSEYISK